MATVTSDLTCAKYLTMKKTIFPCHPMGGCSFSFQGQPAQCGSKTYTVCVCFGKKKYTFIFSLNWGFEYFSCIQCSLKPVTCLASDGYLQCSAGGFTCKLFLYIILSIALFEFHFHIKFHRWFTFSLTNISWEIIPWMKIRGRHQS